MRRCTTVAAVLGAVTWAAWSVGRVSAEEGPPDFRYAIRPLLSKHCFACHGPDEAHQEGGLRLDLREGPIELGSIVPGSPEESELIRRIKSSDPSERMPPPDAARALAAEEIALFENWIAGGAPYSRHWSYEPPIRPPVPKVSSPEWCRNEIDHFILARLEEEGLVPEAEADRARLIRRVSLDLTGLPPTMEEVQAFLRDNRPDAYERLVDRLLASEAYGEHWASKWLDLARFADTNGYEADRRRTVWPYRDWVIRALNGDMPFDQFTIEQLAGDLLPNPTRDQLVATAFHRNTMQNDEGGTDDEEFRVAAVVDRVNTTMQVWIGTTMGCCQCHSHKYDPISQREYYQVFAFFNQSADADRPDGEPSLGKVLAANDTSPGNRNEPAGENAASATEPPSDELAAEFLKLPIMQELPPEEHRTTRIHIRGNFLDQGEVVEAATPAAFNPLPADAPRNRLALARWLVARDNPLTARVVANRQWEQLFGRGIVLTSEDFGSQGTLPTHPELLDWLAVELMENDWSIKHLTKTIVMSAAYRQSGRATDEKLTRDPENALVARGPRGRLTAEQIRDQALAVSGLLSRKVGGPSVMPPQPDGIWKVVYNADQWKTSEGEDRYRRGLYTFIRRTSPYPSAIALDATSRETCTIRRISTNTPASAFALLNDPVYIEAAQRLARLIHDHDGSAGTSGRVEFAFRRVLCRDPSPAERERLTSLYESELAFYEANPELALQMATSALATADSGDSGRQMGEVAAWTVVANVLLNLDEALTR